MNKDAKIGWTIAEMMTKVEGIKTFTEEELDYIHDSLIKAINDIDKARQG